MSKINVRYIKKKCERDSLFEKDKIYYSKIFSTLFYRNICKTKKIGKNTGCKE